MLNEFEYSERPSQSVRIPRSGNTRSGNYARVIPMQPDDAAIPEDADFLYPQELEEIAEPAPRQRRPRGARPMPKRLSEEFEEEAKAPATRKRSARASASEAPQSGEQIPLKLRTPPKKQDSAVKQRQVLGVLLIM